ncbi:MAG: WbuC family cupin fold metalloprotein [Candidatus Cyclobacteriaceae bacterium M3_2C_046]
MIKINQELVQQVSSQAQSSQRKRMNYNFHQQAGDTLHRMLNALEPGTYIRPHKHQDPDKREAFILLRGKVLVVEFDEEGKVSDHIILSESNGNFGVEIPPRTYHSLIALEKNSVIYEIKDGPYNPENDKNFAGWAPDEASPQGNGFNQKILRALDF